MKRRAEIILMGLLIVSCTDFPSRYENIEGNKTRPFAVICEPPEAAPGDTVDVRLVCYFPQASPRIHWKVAMDFASDLYNNTIIEGRYLDLDNMMLPGSTPEHFRFIVPDSALFYSTYLRTVFAAQKSILGDLSFYQVDSLLKASFPIPDSLVDQFGCKVKLIADIQSDIFLQLYKFLTVRYSSRYNSPNTNRNPVIKNMRVVSVNRKNLTDPDSIPYFSPTYHNLFDTVVVEKDYSYFFVAETLAGQDYLYYSFKDRIWKTDSEEYYCDWFYTNSDYNSGMEMDSLILLQGDGSLLQVPFLPPVNTDMHNFKVYVVVRDYRVNESLVTSGQAYMEASGYFKYTQAYIDSRKGTRGVF